MITKLIRKLLGRPVEGQPGQTPPPSSTQTASAGFGAPEAAATPSTVSTAADTPAATSAATSATPGTTLPATSGFTAPRPESAATTNYQGRDPIVKRRSARPAPKQAPGAELPAAGTVAAGTVAAKSVAARTAGTGTVAAGTVATGTVTTEIVAADSLDAPVIIPAEIHKIDPSLISRNAIRVTQGLQEAGFRAFIVGGAVRDLMLGVAPKDFDVATDATPDQVQRLFRRARIIGRRFQIVHVQFGQDIIEVSTFRALVDPAAEAAATATALAAASASPERSADRSAAPVDYAMDTDAGVDTDEALDSDADSDTDTDVDMEPDRSRERIAAAGTGAGGGQERGRGQGQGQGFGSSDRGRRRRREDPDRRLHAVDASGRVLRDNVWGQQHEDARRRDFTINAMYYDPATQTVLDYHAGMADIHARLLRMIGDPAARYREDPVRMLRVVRFAAKLNFEIEPASREPIAGLADLLNNVPAARVFDEILKLLLSGNALACLTRLRAEGLHRDLLPLLDVALEQSHSEKFIALSLTNTDMRVRAGKPVSPGFLFAALLWHQTQQRWQQHVADGEFPIPALHRAMDEVLDAQTGKLAIQRRFIADMKEIWGMQPRLEKRAGRSALKLLEHPRFRAAYDFLLLRCESGEMDPSLASWWTDFMAGDPGARETLLNNGARGEARPKPRRRRRGGSRAAGPEADGVSSVVSGGSQSGTAFEDD